MRAEPKERLAPQAVALWRLEGALTSAFFLVIGAIASWFLLAPVDAPLALGILPVAVALLVAVVLVGLAPGVRWRRWRYEIGETEVDLQRGLFYITRTLVPLARVQHVDTQQGPLERSFGLATVIFHTAAGPNKIPSLTNAVAADVRDRIAELTREQDEL